MIRLWHLSLFVLGCIAIGCAGFTQPKARWPKGPDGVTRIPYQIVRSGYVQDLALSPFLVAPMDHVSEAAWREAIRKWEAASGGAVEFIEVTWLMPGGTEQGVLIYDSPALSGISEGVVEFYAPGSEVERMRAYCAPPGHDPRLARYWRLHEVGHVLLLPHSKSLRAVMWQLRADVLGAPPVEVTTADIQVLRSLYRPP